MDRVGEERVNTIQQLKQNSHLPGPRANLELLYSFSKTATEDEIRECLALIRNDTENFPDEFVGMCGIVAYAGYVERKSKWRRTKIYKKYMPVGFM